MDSKLSSQSSGISLADISINNISDSELEDEDTVLESNKSFEAAAPLQRMPSDVVRKSEVARRKFDKDFTSSVGIRNVQTEESSVPPSSSSQFGDAVTHGRNGCGNGQPMHLDDVRCTLRENHEMLSDHTLLKELLQSLDKKLAATSESIEALNSDRIRDMPMSYALPNRDPGPNVLSSLAVHKEIPSQRQQKQADSTLESHETSQDLTSALKTLGKHVTFDRTEIGSSSSHKDLLKPTSTEIPRSHQLLKELSSLRWRLAGWEDEGLDPPTDKNSSLVFCHRLLQMLQVCQEQKKHLEDQTITVKEKLRKAKEEVHVLQRLNERRETRLREADTQIAVIQREWINTYAADRDEKLKFQSEALRLKKERDSLKEELSSCEKELQRYKERDRDHQKVKTALEEVENQLTASRKQVADVAEENSRLNKKLNEKQKYLQVLEEVELPNLKCELDDANAKLNSLEKSHIKVTRTNTHLTDDLRMLHDQHKSILEKIVLEEELKDTVMKEKQALEERVYAMSTKMSAAKVELHSHYQSQVKELVDQKTETLQEQLMSLESTLKQNLGEQLDSQRAAHRHALTKIQEGHSKEVQDLCNIHSARVTHLQQQIQQLQEENVALKTQHQTIVAAVSTIINPQAQSQTSQPLNQLLEFPYMASTSTPINTRPVSPQNEKKRLMPRDGSRPASGKSGHSNPRVPCLGRIFSSSSDSDTSVFQDGKQTVRHLASDKLPMSSISSKRIDGCANVVTAQNFSSVPTRGEYREFEYRSLPDLQNGAGVLDKDASKGLKRGGSRNPGLSSRKSGSFSGREMSRPAFRKVYTVSEIDSGASRDFPSLLSGNFEMGRLIEEFKSLRSSTKTSDSEVPTHDTSFDQDPANITLRKLNQVSTLLSQYVNDAPSSH